MKDSHTLPGIGHSAAWLPAPPPAPTPPIPVCFSLSSPECGPSGEQEGPQGRAIWTGCSLKYNLQGLGSSPISTPLCLHLCLPVARKSQNTASLAFVRRGNRNWAIFPSSHPQQRRHTQPVSELGADCRGPDNSEVGGIRPRSSSFKPEM